MARNTRALLAVALVVSILAAAYSLRRVPVMETSASDSASLGEKKPKRTRALFSKLATVDHRAEITLPWVKVDSPKKPPRYLKYKEKLLTKVIDQGDCAACWSIAVTGVLEDRISAYTNGKIIEPLSDQEMISCWAGHGGEGCAVGGIPELAYRYIETNGISLEKDYPYQQRSTNNISPCDKSRLKGKRIFIEPGSIRSLCVDPYQYAEGSRDYNRAIKSNVENMKRELFMFGAICGTVTVFDSLYSYDGLSVYTGPKKGDKFVGGHALEIVGYCEEGVNGEEPGFDSSYWICKNSWSLEHPIKSPSSKGFIYIKMGSNVAGIESRASSARPVITAEIQKHMTDNLNSSRYISREAFVQDPERENYIGRSIKLRSMLKK